MIWQDMLLEDRFSELDLSSALAVAFELPSGDVSVVYSLEQLPSGVSVAAHVVELHGGGFRTLLSIYVSKAKASSNPVDVARSVCVCLNTRVLISDQSANPYTMLLIGASSEPVRVALDVQALDDRNEYYIARCMEQ
ncbi:hypothetical protein WME94_33385 [Sorangium sp. So ce429]